MSSYRDVERTAGWLAFLGTVFAIGIGITACGWVLQWIFGLKAAWTLWESLVIAFLALKLLVEDFATESSQASLGYLKKIEERLIDIEKRLESIDRRR
jgi:hypothetical protein